MKKSSSIVVAIVVIAVVVGVGYALFHKDSKTTTSTAKTSSSSSAPAVNNAILITKTDTNSGQYLADPSGKPLYTYGADTSGVSNCTGSCLTTWPAYVDKGSTSSLPAGVGTITRKDNGQVQYTYNGMPLYYFASDSAGKVTGDGVDNFKLAKPAAASSSSSSSSSTDSNSSSSSPSYNY